MTTLQFLASAEQTVRICVVPFKEGKSENQAAIAAANPGRKLEPICTATAPSPNHKSAQIPHRVAAVSIGDEGAPEPALTEVEWIPRFWGPGCNRAASCGEAA